MSVHGNEEYFEYRFEELLQEYLDAGMPEEEAASKAHNEVESMEIEEIMQWNKRMKSPLVSAKEMFEFVRDLRSNFWEDMSLEDKLEMRRKMDSKLTELAIRIQQ